MTSDEDLASRMRRFESADDGVVPTDVQMVARIDGRSFTRLTREEHDFEAPFDVRFRDCMISAARRLMNTGFGVDYAYTQSDEISLLFAQGERTFGRRRNKLLSVLAGEASAAFTHALGAPAAFDCRISELPSERDVVDYFRWRQEDARRNALGGHCYWLLRAQGLSDRETTARLDGRSMPERRALLQKHGVDFDAQPAWQRRGVGLRWETYEKKGVNPKTGARSAALRRRLFVDDALPERAAYAEYVRALVVGASDAP